MQLDDWVLCRIYKKSKFDVSSSSTEAAISSPEIEIDHHHHKVEMGEGYHHKIHHYQQQQHPCYPQHTLISQKSLSFSNLLDATDYSMLSTFLSSDNHSASNNAALIHADHKIPPPLLGPNNGPIRPKRQFSQDHHHDDNTTSSLLYPPNKKYHITSSNSCTFPETTNNLQYDTTSTTTNDLLKPSFFNNNHLLLAPDHLRFQG